MEIVFQASFFFHKIIKFYVYLYCKYLNIKFAFKIKIFH